MKHRRPLKFRRRLRLGGALAGAFLAAALSRSPGASAEVLHTVAQIRALTPEQSQAGLPVQLRGVVTFYDESLFSHFLQDATAGIYFKFPTNVAPPALVPGQVVEVAGRTSPGEYAPVVVVEQWKVVGQAPLPAPKPVTYEQLAGGSEDSQFVEITGIVHSIRRLDSAPYFEIEIATGGGRLHVFARDLPVARAEELPDSTVRVRGVCSTQFNHQRQLFAIRLMVPRRQDLQIEIPAPQDPFAVPASPIGSLLQFTPQGTYGHRVKVIGTVIYFEPGQALYLQDGDHGVEVETRERAPLRIGQRAEALGFVAEGDYTPRLTDGVYREIPSTETGGAPRPVRLTADEALTGEHDCQLIEVAARLIDRGQRGAEQYLILQESNFIFEASLESAPGRDVFESLQNGSRVAVTGVCRIEPGEWQAGENWRAKSFRLLLRSPADVVLLAAPPWWTLQKMLWIAGALGLAALVAFGWVAVLRRQVAERTRELEVQIQKRQLAERRREIEQERARLAQDLHDDLGAGLTEVNMLTTLAQSPATSPEEKARYLTELRETALRMIGSLDEIVWAVNPRNDTIASLASYFGAYAQRLLDLASVACALDIAEDLPEHPLDPRFRRELFFAFKEALTNIIRHAGATLVWLRISAREGWLRVELADNGRGFDARTRQTGDDGIANMHARLRTLGGDCEIVSDAQSGTTVRFRAPLPKTFL
jgi:signal transduction histidine kinase